MNFDTAISFLRSHQPIPPDEQIEADLIGKYDEVRRYFLEHPDPACIPLFLNSFGDGDGLGVYPLIEDVIQQFSHGEMNPHLVQALHSKYDSVRYWCLQVATSFTNAEMLDVLSPLLLDPGQTRDIRFFAAVCIRHVADVNALKILEQAFRSETDTELRSEIWDMIQKLIKVG